MPGNLEEYNQFVISRRQYDLIIKQALDCLPEEAGGFLGGRDGMIQGVLPLYNMSADDRETNFVFLKEEYQRAHEFFERHGLQYFGVYHSHPEGITHPSAQDLKMNQRYQFIVGVQDPSQPELAAFRCHGYSAKPTHIQIISDHLVTVVDIHAHVSATMQDHPNDVAAEMSRLFHMVECIQEEKMSYPFLTHPEGQEGFSTIA